MKGLPWAFKNKGDDARLHPSAAIGRAIGDAGFFQIQFVFDAPSRFVGDLAVAQQFINEIAFGLDQLGLDLGGLAHVVEAFGQVRRQHLQAALIARSQVLDRVVRQVVLFDDFLQPFLDLFQRRLPRA